VLQLLSTTESVIQRLEEKVLPLVNNYSGDCDVITLLPRPVGSSYHPLVRSLFGHRNSFYVSLFVSKIFGILILVISVTESCQ